MPHWHDQQNGLASLLTVPIPSCRGSTGAQVLESGDPSVKRVFTAWPEPCALVWIPFCFLLHLT